MTKKTKIKILTTLLIIAVIVIGVATALMVVANKNNVTIATQWQNWGHSIANFFKRDK